MNEEGSPSQSGDEPVGERNPSQLPDETVNSRMRARRWVIAYRFSVPADYDIPELPSWTVSRTDSNGLSFARDHETEPFISAEQPVRVRR